MADPKVYVEIGKFTVAEIFDSKHASRVVTVATKLAEQAIKGSSKLTLDEPKDRKTAKGWGLVSAISVGPDKAGKKFEAAVSMTITTWPGKAMKAFPTGSGRFEIASADEKIAASDVDLVVTEGVKQAMKTALSFLEKTKPS